MNGVKGINGEGFKRGYSKGFNVWLLASITNVLFFVRGGGKSCVLLEVGSKPQCVTYKSIAYKMLKKNIELI